MIKEYFKIAINNFSHRKLRSWLTLIGILIGVASVVAIISLSHGLNEAIRVQFEKLGNDKLLVTPNSAFIGGDSTIQLVDKDKKTILGVKGVDSAMGIEMQSAKIEYKRKNAYVIIEGVPVSDDEKLVHELFDAYGLAEGRLISGNDHNKVVLGNEYSKPLDEGGIFNKRVNLGDKILINDKKFKVVGIFNSFGNSVDDSSIIIPQEDYDDIFDIKKPSYNMIFVKVLKGEDPSVVADRITRELRNERDLDEGDEDFEVQSTEELLNSFNSILLIVKVVVVGIAAISLLVGGVGIANTMYTSVLERRREIGVMKAVGARNSDVLMIFIIEAGLLGLAGGLAGLLIGLGISKGTELFGRMILETPYLKAWCSPSLIIITIIASFLIGVVSGASPAYQASRQKPVDALRYE